jgi:hypothetical protein
LEYFDSIHIGDLLLHRDLIYQILCKYTAWIE